VNHAHDLEGGDHEHVVPRLADLPAVGGSWAQTPSGYPKGEDTPGQRQHRTQSR